MDFSNLLGEDSSFTNLSSSEKDVLKQLMLSEASRRTKASKYEQIREIVDIEKWVDSEYYVGPDCIRVYDYWKELMCEIFDSKRKPEERINEVILSGSIGVGKSCQNRETRVPTSLGLLSLEDLYERFHVKGERFKVLAESGWKDCIDVVDNGMADTKIIKFKSGRHVECTYNHKFRVIRDGSIEWIESKDLVIGDSFLMTRKESPFGFKTLNLDVAYTLGYLSGNGCITEARYKLKDMSLQKTRAILGIVYPENQTKVVSQIESAYSQWFRTSNTVDKVLNDGTSLVYRRGQSKEFVEYLLDQGFGLGAEYKDIPKFILESNKQVVAKYIQGLMDSDGTIGKNGKIDIMLKSKKLIDGLGELLSMFGISYTKTVKTLKNYGDFYRLLIVNPESYIIYAKEIGFSIDYKSQRLEEYLKLIQDPNYGRNDRLVVPDAVLELRRLDNKQKLKLTTDTQSLNSFRCQPNMTLRQLKKIYEVSTSWLGKSDYLKYICDNNNFFDEIVSIEEGHCHTMDLSVDSDHSYCFQGFISHNTVSELILMRRLYEMSCYKNINALFELMLKTHITFLYFSVNKQQAERTGFGEMRSWLDGSPYFQECFERNKKIDSLMAFPENILFAFGSGTQHSIGMSVMGSILDEANFFSGDTSGESNKVAELYASIVNRSNSRFIIQGGINYSLNILVSSSTHESSFTEKRIQQSKGKPNVLVRCPTQWEVKPGKFSGKFFYVCKGTNFLDPYIINSVDDINQYRIAEGMSKCKSEDGETDQKVIDEEIESLPTFKQLDFLSVPTDLKNGFETNIIKSLQDMGGVSVAPTGRLFSNKPVYQANCRSNMRHPFINETIVISTGDDIKIQDYLRKDMMFADPTKPRYLHIDQSVVTDCTGISSVYVKDIVEIDGVKKPMIGVDFMLRIEPPKAPKRIAIYKIRDFVVYLHYMRKLKLGMVSYDIFNSEESRQILEEMGLNVRYLSVDRNDKAYVDLVTLFFEERMYLYDYNPFSEELFSLIHDRGRRKVDHPKELGDGRVGSKDVSDSLAGAVHNALSTSFVDHSMGDGINDFLRANSSGIVDSMGNPLRRERSVGDLIDREIDRMMDDMMF